MPAGESRGGQRFLRPVAVDLRAVVAVLRELLLDGVDFFLAAAVGAFLAVARGEVLRAGDAFAEAVDFFLAAAAGAFLAVARDEALRVEEAFVEAVDLFLAAEAGAFLAADRVVRVADFLAGEAFALVDRRDVAVFFAPAVLAVFAVVDRRAVDAFDAVERLAVVPVFWVAAPRARLAVVVRLAEALVRFVPEADFLADPFAAAAREVDVRAALPDAVFRAGAFAVDAREVDVRAALPDAVFRAGAFAVDAREVDARAERLDVVLRAGFFAAADGRATLRAVDDVRAVVEAARFLVPAFPEFFAILFLLRGPRYGVFEERCRSRRGLLAAPQPSTRAINPLRRASYDVGLTRPA